MRTPSPLALASLLAAVAVPIPAADWPQHRGADGSGVAVDAGVFPAGPFALEVAWRRPLGSGYSGVSIAGDAAVAAASAGEDDWIVVFDARSGEERWRSSLGPTYRGHDGSHDGPVATPAVGGGRVHALGPRGRLVTFDLATGRELWSLDLAARPGVEPPTYGFGASPVLAGGTLVVGAGGEPAILGLDPATGAVRWAVGRDRFTYQTPLVGDGATVLVGGNTRLFAVEPATGRVAWEHEHGGGWAQGTASLIPVRTADGALFLKHTSDASKLVRPSAEGAGTRLEELWTGPAIRGTYAAPVLFDGHLYGFTGHFLTAVEAASGTTRWRSRAPGDGFVALADGRLVVATKSGEVHVGRASVDGWTGEAALAVFSDFVWTAPSIADGAIFVRSLGEIARLEARPLGAVASAFGTAPARPVAAGEGAVARFMAALEAAPVAARSAEIDAFFAEHGPPPVVEGDTAHFFYRGAASDVAIAADAIDEELPMARVAGADLFHRAVRLEPDARTSYRFRVDYDREIPDPTQPRREKGPDHEVSWMAMPGWREPAYLPAIDGAPLAGRVETHTLGPEGAEARRVVDVYLPPGYDDGADRRYPVLVVHDGEAARGRGRFDRVFDALIVSGVVSPFVAAFVHPRSDDELYDDFAAYRRALGQEVLPWLDSTYRTVAAPGARVSYAAGYPAAIALHAAWGEEPLFGGAALQSPFLLTSEEEALAASLRRREERPLVVYHDWGRYDWRSVSEAWDTVVANRRLSARLRDAGYRPAGGEVPDGRGWWAWRARVDRVLAAFFPASAAR